MLEGRDVEASQQGFLIDLKEIRKPKDPACVGEVERGADFWCAVVVWPSSWSGIGSRSAQKVKINGRSEIETGCSPRQCQSHARALFFNPFLYKFERCYTQFAGEASNQQQKYCGTASSTNSPILRTCSWVHKISRAKRDEAGVPEEYVRHRALQCLHRFSKETWSFVTEK